MALRLTITAQSPLIFADHKPGGSYRDSLAYIPGGVIRAAFAAQRHGDQHVADTLLFGAQAARFSHALPSLPTDLTIGVVPQTALTCKRDPGFATNRSDPKHGVFDTLLPRLAWDALRPAGLVYDPRCPRCGETTDTLAGCYAETITGLRARSVPQRLLTRVAINRRRMVAEEGLLYSPYVMSETMRLDKILREDPTRWTMTQFTATVSALDDTHIPTFNDITALGGRTRQGLGAVQVEAILDTSNLGDANVVKTRIHDLNTRLADIWRRYQGLVPLATPEHSPNDGVYWSITLHADAILSATTGLPTVIFDADQLATATGGELKGAQLVASHATAGLAGGWSQAWGLPKPTQPMARAGSVFVFWRQGSLSEDEIAALAALEVQGIGERTTEGYGAVRVADPFHLNSWENPV